MHQWGSITGDNAFGYTFLGAQGVGGFQKTVLLVFTQVWGYAKVWGLGRFWLRLGARFGGAADPGFTPSSRGFCANPEKNPLGYIFSLSRPLAIEPMVRKCLNNHFLIELKSRTKKKQAKAGAEAKPGGKPTPAGTPPHGSQGTLYKA